LLESELFGHEKGSFTGAHRRKPGKFELAHRGTFLLDEIGEMPLGLQAKLLHVLQDGQFFRVGGSEVITSDARLIAATNKNLLSVMATGFFREDLFYRLNVVTVQLPPLRDRKDAIPLLIEHFLDMYNRQYGKDLKQLSPRTVEIFHSYHWPGNVRELENMVKRMVVLGSETTVLEEIAHRSASAASTAGANGPLDLEALGVDWSDAKGVDLKAIAKRAAQIAEKRVIERVLDQTRWNRKEAAERLQISYKALLYKMKDNGLSQAG
ncbi:sigma-54-dependent Fis family transcriptional regulator, partial [bacterium]